MTFLERTRRPEAFRHWPGDVEADYRYTTGVAGERFFVELRDSGRIFAAKCAACDRLYLPPRLYCENCLGSLADWREVTGPATVEGVTVVHLDDHGAPLSPPEVWALLRWPAVFGGLVHRLAVSPDRAKPGMRVRPILRPRAERTGTIADILHFAP